MFELLQRLNAEGSTVLYVTHDRELAARAHRMVTIRDGVVADGEEAAMSSAVVRKSVTDLTRRKARAFFTVLTLALAVASIGIFAVPGVMQQAMDREVAANRLADVTVTMKPLDAARPRSWPRSSALPNVAAVEPRTSSPRASRSARGGTRRWLDRRRPTSRAQRRRRRRARQGRAARRQRARRGGQRPQGRLRRLRGADRHRRRVACARCPSAARARNLLGGSLASGTSRRSTRRAETVAAIAGADGYTSLSFRLRRPQPRGRRARRSRPCATQLRATTAFAAFGDLPADPRAGRATPARRTSRRWRAS